MNNIPLRHCQRLAVDAGNTEESEVRILDLLARVERARAGQDTFIPRELAGFAKLFLSELDAVKIG